MSEQPEREHPQTDPTESHQAITDQSANDEVLDETNDDERTFAYVSGINPRQESAIIALLNEHNIRKAAKASGVGVRTIYRWLTEPAFLKVYRKARREAFSQAVALTQRYAPLAVNTLAKIMVDESAPHSARVQAATTILRFGREGIELEDIATRLDALETAAEQALEAA